MRCGGILGPFWAEFVQEKRQRLGRVFRAVFRARIVGMKAGVRLIPWNNFNLTGRDGTLRATIVK